jgi:hypothetical protein
MARTTPATPAELLATAKALYADHLTGDYKTLRRALRSLASQVDYRGATDDNEALTFVVQYIEVIALRRDIPVIFRDGKKF